MNARQTTDPLIAFLKNWEVANEEMRALPSGRAEAFYLAHISPCELLARDGQLPEATTAAGAAAALSMALFYEDIEDQDANLVRAGLAYLEASIQPAPIPSLADGLTITEAVAVAKALRAIRSALSPLIMQKTSQLVVAVLERLYDRNRVELQQVADAISAMVPTIVSEVHDRTDFLLSEAVHSGEAFDYLAEVLAEGQAQAAAIEARP